MPPADPRQQPATVAQAQPPGRSDAAADRDLTARVAKATAAALAVAALAFGLWKVRAVIVKRGAAEERRRGTRISSAMRRKR